MKKIRTKEEQSRMSKRHYENNKLAYLMYQQLERLTFPEVVSERRKVERLKNSKKTKERRSRYYKKHKIRADKARDKWRKENPERHKEKKRNSKSRVQYGDAWEFHRAYLNLKRSIENGQTKKSND